MKPKNVLVMFLVLLLFWLLVNNSLALPIVLTGVGLSLFLALVLCRSCSVFAEMRITPKSLIYTVWYLLFFLWELIKSNLDVARRVLSPRLPINPGIIKVTTRLKSPMGRMILANSISLTPGTFTVDVRGEDFYIHWIDVKTEDSEEASRKIVEKFEKYLEVIYG